MKAQSQSPERRIVTMLHYDLVGSTRHIADCEPEEARDNLRRWLAPAQAAVLHAGGFVVDPEGDGGLAVFGWPNACEDHADRACAAAWDLQHADIMHAGPRTAGGAPIRFRVGVHSGLVFFWREDGRARVSGVPVHIAAALQKAAPPGGVLVSTKTLSLCRAKLLITPQKRPSALDELNIDVLSLDARPQDGSEPGFARRYEAPMIGRVDELAMLRRRLPSGADPGPIAVIGEAGVGKSRLTAALAAEAQADGVQTLVFFGDRQKTATPFAAARTLILQALHMSPPLSSEALSAGLTHAGVDAETVERLVPVLLSRRASKRRRDANQTPTLIARALATTFKSLIQTQPTLAIIEDLHLLDPESRLFVRMLARMDTPVSLVLTTRPEAASDARDIAAAAISLAALPDADMAALARRLWSGAALTQSALSELLRRADGVPFVLEQIISALDPAGPPRFDPLPDSVKSVIHARLSQLSLGAKATVQALSLLGDEVELSIAKGVLGRSDERLARELAELEDFAFIDPRTGSNVRFRHQTITESCLETLPRERRERLHRAAVAALLADASDLSGRYERLTVHAEGAGEFEQALEFLWESGVAARDSSAGASLRRILAQAARLAPRAGPAGEEKYVDFVLMAFATLLQAGEFDEMKTVLPHITDLARKQDRPDKVCSAMSQMAMLCWFEGDYETGFKVAEAALPLAQTLHSLPLIFSNQLMLANNLHGLGQVTRAIATLDEVCSLLTGELETARLGAAATPSAMAHAFMSWFLLDIGAYDAAIAHGDRALAIAVREADAYAEVLARHSLGRALVLAERNQEGLECLERALRISETNGYDAIKPHATGSLSIALSRCGRAEEAVALGQACFDQGLHQRTGKLERYHLYAGYAEALFAAGQIERCFANLDAALRIARDINNPCLIADGLALRAHLCRAAGLYPQQADEDLAELGALTSRLGLVTRSFADVGVTAPA